MCINSRQDTRVSKKNNVIEINGKRYDATTGALLHNGHSTKAVAAPAVKHATPAKHKPSMLDVRPAASHHRHGNQPQPTHTLMRQAVSKPAASAKSHLKAHGHVSHELALAKAADLQVLPKTSALTVDDRRLRHAKAVHKSKLISRYSDATPATGAAPAFPLPTPTARPVMDVVPQAASRPHPVNARPQTTADLLQQAIEQATSHEQPAPKLSRLSRAGRPHRRVNKIASVSSLAVLSVAMFGFVLHQNMPSIKLDLASSKAGFAASLPASRPAGYSLSKLSSSIGQVDLNYQSGGNTQGSFTITEKQSNWDSATLRDMYVAQTSGDQYQTVQTAGRTLYLYGQQNVTWVNGGIWYLLHSDGSLTNQQLIDTASSL